LYEKNNGFIKFQSELVLPELMSSNIKLDERLKNKLKVSTLLNNIKQRNCKYLKVLFFLQIKSNFLKKELSKNNS
jgi:hypothetical protein